METNREEIDIFKLYTNKEVCKMIGYSRNSLLQFRKDKKIGYFTINGIVKYTLENIEDFIKNNSVAANPATDININKLNKSK